MQTKFEQCIPFTRFHEGGEVDSEIDRGGHTFYGISQFWKQYYPAFFANPTPEGAKDILKAEFWDPYELDSLPVHVAVVCFDMLVNHKAKDAVRQIQRGAGKLKKDGVWGEKTKARLREDGISIPRILQWRIWLYGIIADKYPEQKGNMAGWIWRTHCLNRYSLGLQAGINVHPNGDLLQ